MRKEGKGKEELPVQEPSDDEEDRPRRAMSRAWRWFLNKVPPWALLPLASFCVGVVVMTCMVPVYLTYRNTNALQDTAMIFPASYTEDQLRNSADMITVELDLIGIQAGVRSAQFLVSLYLGDRYEDPDHEGIVQLPYGFYLDVSLGWQSVELDTGSALRDTVYTFILQDDKRLSQYPFDEYSLDMTIRASLVDGRNKTNVTEQALPVGILLYEGEKGWETHSSLTAYTSKSGTLQYGAVMAMDMKRAVAVKFFSIFIVVLMWFISLTIFTISLNFTLSSSLEITFDVPALAVGFLFALPFLRDVQPGVPPVGVTVDILGYFFSMLLIAGATVMTLFALSSRYHKAQKKLALERQMLRATHKKNISRPAQLTHMDARTSANPVFEDPTPSPKEVPRARTYTQLRLPERSPARDRSPISSMPTVLVRNGSTGDLPNSLGSWVPLPLGRTSQGHNATQRPPASLALTEATVAQLRAASWQRSSSGPAQAAGPYASHHTPPRAWQRSPGLPTQALPPTTTSHQANHGLPGQTGSHAPATATTSQRPPSGSQGPLASAALTESAVSALARLGQGPSSQGANSSQRYPSSHGTLTTSQQPPTSVPLTESAVSALARASAANTFARSGSRQHRTGSNLGLQQQQHQQQHRQPTGVTGVVVSPFAAMQNSSGAGQAPTANGQHSGGGGEQAAGGTSQHSSAGEQAGVGPQRLSHIAEDRRESGATSGASGAELRVTSGAHVRLDSQTKQMLDSGWPPSVRSSLPRSSSKGVRREGSRERDGEGGPRRAKPPSPPTPDAQGAPKDGRLYSGGTETNLTQ